jgi:hypothetical protein
MSVIFSRIFALDVNAKPTLTFEVRNTREAQQLCKEPWLRADMNSLKSNGILICDDTAKFSVRHATTEEESWSRLSEQIFRLDKWSLRRG